MMYQFKGAVKWTLVLGGHFCQIRIGFGHDIIGEKSSIVLRISGLLLFKGSCFLGQGCKIEVCKNSYLEFGTDTTITSKSVIICTDRICIGAHCRVSWNVTIMDTDWHMIKKQGFESEKKIVVGDHCWIGMNVSILKGSIIGSNCVIGAHSLVNKKFRNSHLLITGCPAKIIRESVEWF